MILGLKLLKGHFYHPPKVLIKLGTKVFQSASSVELETAWSSVGGKYILSSPGEF